MTDNKSLTNAVWTSGCDSGADGQRWFYFGDTLALANRFGDDLRTSPGSDAAVYSEQQYLTWGDWMKWKGTHT
jgi:hypothetical protein